MDGGGVRSGGEVAVVVVVVVVVIGYWWWRSGGCGAHDRLCKWGSCNSWRSAIVQTPLESFDDPAARWRVRMTG